MITRRQILALITHSRPCPRSNNVTHAFLEHKRCQEGVKNISNVTLSSALGARNFTASSHALEPLREEPIDVEAFEKALQTCWTPLLASDLPDKALPCPPHGIGLAVSGGVDSMALAGLCKRLQDSKPSHYHFHAIVVDHQARSGSSQEAAEVRHMLQSMGLDASTRTIQWPAKIKAPLSLPDFETRARRERYRHLGLECASRGLRYLLLAHHGNDQTEGILGRIIAGYTGPGLEGMQRLAPIPECGGLWGASEGPNRFRQPRSAQAIRTSSASKGAKGISPVSQLDVQVAAAGITIHRPFLPFTKSALRRTCEGLSIQWKEDETNLMLGLTLRNTARSLLHSKKLPLALRERSLIGLAACKSKLNVHHEKACDDVLDRMHAVAFDSRFGQLTLSLSHEDVSNICEAPRMPFRMDLETRNKTFPPRTLSLVKRLATIVSPRTHIKQHVASDIANAFIGAIQGTGQSRFTGGGVWWRREADRKLDPQTSLQAWTLCRQPISRHEPRKICRWISPSIESDGSPAEQLQNGHVQPFGTWQLLDNRFWLRVEHGNQEPVTARLLEEADLRPFRDSLDRMSRKRLNDELSSVAPGEMTFALPALVDGSGALLALPTLGYVRPVSRKKLKWEWCYKHIRLGQGGAVGGL